MWGQDLVVFKISHWSAWIAAAPEWIQPQVKVKKKILQYRVALVICICCAHKDEFQMSNQVRNGTQIRATHAGLSRLSTSAGNCLISAAWFKSLENCDSYVFDCFGGKNSFGCKPAPAPKKSFPLHSFTRGNHLVAAALQHWRSRLGWQRSFTSFFGHQCGAAVYISLLPPSAKKLTQTDCYTYHPINHWNWF